MSDDKKATTTRESFRRYLRRRKMRCTPERLAILDAVLEPGMRRFSAESLHQAIVGEGFHLSVATVYNTIGLLEDCGLVRRHYLGNGSTASYEKVQPTAAATRIHLICSGCGKVREVTAPELSRAIAQKDFAGFAPEGFTLYYHGLCKVCMRKRRSKEPNSNQK